MDAGQIVEFDTPANLLRARGTLFELAKSTGKDNFKKLKQISLDKERLSYPDMPVKDGIDDAWEDLNAVKQMHEVQQKRAAAKEAAEAARLKLENAFGEENDLAEVDMLGEEEYEGEEEEKKEEEIEKPDEAAVEPEEAKK